MFKIGNVEVKNKVISAPQAGIANIAWRELMKEMGAGLVYSEMISIEGFKYNSKKTLEMMKVSKNEHPVSLQIFGNNVESFVNAAKYIDKNTEADIIDINVGCPVTKVAIKSKAGSALLKDIDELEKIINSIVNAISKPLTIKIRVGWDDQNLNYLEVAKMAERAGASAIAVHARTKSQMYTGKANWNYIKEIKEAVSIPVIGNGDIKTPEDAKKMLETTNCDAVMIARGTHGNPWIFKQINDYLETGEYSIPTKQDKKDLLIYQAKKLIDLKGEEIAIREMRFFVSKYLKNIKNSNSITSNLSKINTLKELEQELEKI
ncbi:MAG: tRNA dihydrouridine synthase DusB [Mycoplasma sp.]|nr:tRNA dihydrouridine synthase DusB [Mycoplasma sp.]